MTIALAEAVTTKAPGPPAVDYAITCWRCKRKLAEYAARPWEFTCPRCKACNKSAPAAA